MNITLSTVPGICCDSCNSAAVRIIETPGCDLALCAECMDALRSLLPNPELEAAQEAIRHARKMLRAIEFGPSVPLLDEPAIEIRDSWLDLPAVRAALDNAGQEV